MHSSLQPSIIFFCGLVCFISGFQPINGYRHTTSTSPNVLISHKSHTYTPRPCTAVFAEDVISAESTDRPCTLITTPLFYLNSSPHLGHAYTLVAADVLKRYNILIGKNVKLLFGTDEHGTKIEQAASALGKTPEAHVEELRSSFLRLLKAYNVKADIHVHTTNHEHKEKVKHIFKLLQSSGDIYQGIHCGYFSPKEDLYYTESQLIDGKSPPGFDVVPVAEQAHFFKMGKWQSKLRELFYNSPDLISPRPRRNEVLKWLEDGLSDIAITRRNCEWGIKISETETIYVWFDALLGYLHDFIVFHHPNSKDGNGYGEITHPPNVAGSPACRMMHVIGKDILRFHALLWPAMLFSLGLEPPAQLITHGWLLSGGSKVSKSVGNVIDPYISQDSDVARFTLLTLGEFGEDFEYNSRRVEAARSMILDLFANACHRATSLLEQRGVTELQPYQSPDPEILEYIELASQLENDMSLSRFDLYINHVCEIAVRLNRYVSREQPWNIKDEKEFKKKMHIICEGLALLAIYISPVMPCMASNILERLNPVYHGPINMETVVERGFGIIEDITLFTFRPIHGEHLL